MPLNKSLKEGSVAKIREIETRRGGGEVFGLSLACGRGRKGVYSWVK